MPKASATALAALIVCGPLAFNAQGALPLPTSWEVAGQFRATANTPSTLWQYGWRSTPLSANFNHLTFALPSPQWPNGFKGYQQAANYGALPVIYQNQKTVPNFLNSNQIAARAVILHPGDQIDEVAVLRFKAPRAAHYRVSGQFYAGDAGGAGTRTGVSLVATLPSQLTPTTLWSGNINYQTQPQASFTSTQVMLNAGSVLDFVVSGAPPNDWANGSTGLNAVIEIIGCYRGPFDPPCDPE